MGELLTVVGLNAASSAASSVGNYITMQQQAKLQKEAQVEQNQWQSAENDKDRSWQESTWLDHFLKENQEYANRLQLQQNQWQKQFDVTNQYNSPTAQMARLRAAGINPSVLVGSSGSLASLGQSGAVPSSSSSASQPSPSSFAGHSVAPAAAPSFGGLSSPAQSFTSVAQLADSVAAVKRAGADVKRINALLPSEVETAVNNAAISNQKRILSEIETNVASSWLDKKAGAEFSKLVADSYAAYTSGDLSKANELVSIANERLVSLESEIKAEQRPQLLANLKELQSVYKTEEMRNKAAASASVASAASAYSSAEYSRQLSETEKQLRSGRVTSQVLQNAISRSENMLRQRENLRDLQTNEWKIWKILQECKAQGYATAEQLERWKKASKDNDSYELRLILQEINSSMPSVVVPLK